MEQQSHYVGLDVSLETTSICVIDDAGAIIWRGKCSSALELADLSRPRGAGSAAAQRVGMINPKQLRA
jgi:transposase